MKIGAYVIGFETNVLTAATGKLARRRNENSAANGIWNTGTRKPKNTPIATPTATLRRLRCHNHGLSSRGPSQRRLLRARNASFVGSQRCNFLRATWLNPSHRGDRAQGSSPMAALRPRQKRSQISEQIGLSDRRLRGDIPARGDAPQ